MMKKVFHVLIATFSLILLTETSTWAQEDNPNTAAGSIGFNMDKVELLYREVEVTQTSTSSTYGMRSRSYMIEFPFFRANGGELQEIDRRGQVFSPFFTKCPTAKKEITLFAKEHRRAQSSFWLCMGIGGTLGLGSVLVTGATGGESSGPFITGMTLCFGSMVTGFILANNHAKKAKKHLESAVINYNQACYVAQAGNKPVEDGAPATQPDQPGTGIGVIHEYRDTAFYKLLRNKPAKLRWWTLGVDPANLVISNSHGVSYRMGVDFTYQNGAKMGIQGAFKYALINNLHADTYQGGDPDLDFSYHDVAVGQDYKKGIRGQLLAWFNISGKTHQKEEDIFLGKNTYYGRNVGNYTKIETDRHRNWAIRVGAETFRSILQETDSGLPFQTNAPPLVYTDPVSGQQFEEEWELGNAAVMIHSFSATAGIAFRTTTDTKIDLLSTNLKGIKEYTSFREWYVDLMFAPILELGSLDYYDYVSDSGPIHQHYEIEADATPLSRLGGRIGCRNTYLKKNAGFTFYAETGSRPGLKGDGYNTSLPSLYLEIGAIFHLGGRMK